MSAPVCDPVQVVNPSKAAQDALQPAPATQAPTESRSALLRDAGPVRGAFGPKVCIRCGIPGHHSASCKAPIR